MQSLFKGVFLLGCLMLASCSPAPAPKCQSQSKEEAKKAERALADFAVNIYKNASADREQQGKNQAISPVSIALALALVENGADGQSRQQIRQQLLENGASEEVLSVYRALEKQLQQDSPKARLQIANAIFHDQKTQLKQEYEQSTKQCLDAQVDEADFQKDPEQARQKINKFISQKTQQKIQELFKQGSLKQDTRVVLANAIYFKAAWQNSFDKQQTKSGTFYRQGREQQQVQMMKTRGDYRHSSDDKLQVVELPYDKEQNAMYVILPKQRDGIKEVERDLNGDKLRSILSNLQSKKVEIQLPKFAVRSSLNLKQALSKMGVRDIFQDNADLSRMTEQKLKIGEAVHQAYVHVDENGTEAAAATGFGAETMSAQEPQQFNADHPFLYTIVHKPTGAIVFIGKVNEVQEQADE